MRPPSAAKVSEWMSALGPWLRQKTEGVETVTRELLESIVRKVVETAAPSSKEMRRPEATSAAMSSILHLEGRRMELPLVIRNVYRLLANLNFIHDGMEIPEWDGGRESTSAVFLSVKGVGDEGSVYDRYILEVKLKTGVCAGIITCAVLSRRSLNQFLMKESGTSKFECAVEEVSGMEATLTVSLNDHGLLQVHERSCSETQRKHNRELAKLRRDPLKCAKAPMPCNVCGCSTRECPLAVWKN